MSDDTIIELYTELANNPDKEFGWEKGRQNAINHGYKKEWINAIPESVWEYCGESGKVLGVDITPAMVEKARQNARLAGLSNITVYEASIEKLPVENSCVNIVISNGAINLAASKENVFSEIYRVLRTGGHLYFSDMIKDESHQKSSCEKNESWADCVAGTLSSDKLIQLMQEAGFVDAQLISINHYKTSPSTVGATFMAIKL